MMKNSKLINMEKVKIVRLGNYVKLESTRDCIDAINMHYKASAWKRTSRFNINIDEYQTSEVRVFSDGTEKLTVINIDLETILCKDLDLKEHKDLIFRIKEVGKCYFTHDYGEMWYNPYAKKVLISGGDGGIIYDTISTKRELEKKFEEDDSFDGYPGAPLIHTIIPDLNDSTFEAELSPDPYHEEDTEDEHINYIQIGEISVLEL